MGVVRDRIADGMIRAAKSFAGLNVPEAMEQAAENVSHMGPTSPFSPGEPIGPYDGYSRHPRQRDFVTGYNIATRPRTHERVSFDTLHGLIQNYDVAQICINHRIDSVRSLDWKLVAADWYDGDVDDAINLGMKALDKPDRVHYFETWLGMWLNDVLAYDAGALYRLRNKAGRCIGLLPVDGTTIAPLLDYWGGSPEPPAEAYVQYVQGLPWNWLTRNDLVYEPYRLHNKSPYGVAPIESILLNANTDIRFQLYFLQRFTDGNLPAAFAAAPESWSPDQIEQFQEYWDGFMYGDQSRKHQVIWMPGGSSFAWSDEKDFNDHFSLFMMRKTAAAYHVVPADLGFTENVNRSSGESQADVQHRVGDLPFLRYISRILTGHLQGDLGLPIKHQFDLGEEQADRVQQAQADKIYVDMGAISPSKISEMRYGIADANPIPRFIMTSRGGPVPISALLAVAGPVDPATALPPEGIEPPHKVFAGAEGVLPNPPLHVMSLGERQFGPSAMPPAPPPQPQMTPADMASFFGTDDADDQDDETAQVGKEAAAAGITSGTGVYSYDGPGERPDDDDDEMTHGQVVDDETARALVAKAELDTFRRFATTRRRAGKWRDFEFTAVDAVTAHRLNDYGRAVVRKAAGQVGVAGLAVKATDTGRVLMLQRALTDDDPAAGTWEFPGGHLEQGETPLAAAWREWAEETGAIPPPGVQTGSWTAGDGFYMGIVWTVDAESMVPVRGEGVVPNPDDPDGDMTEAVAWWDPSTLAGNPAVRSELAGSLDVVMQALGLADPPPPPLEDEVAKAAPWHPFKGRGGSHTGCTRNGCGKVRTDPVHTDVAKAAKLAQIVVRYRKATDPARECGTCVMLRQGPDGLTCTLVEDPIYRDGVCDQWYPAKDADAVAKAGDAGPKGRKRRQWPAWKLDGPTAEHWAPELTAAVEAALTRDHLRSLAAAYLADHPDQDGDATGKRDRNAAAVVWLTEWLANNGINVDVGDQANGIVTDGYLIGGASAAAMVNDQPVDLGGWQPGNTEAAHDRVNDLGAAATLAALLDKSDTADVLTYGYLDELGRLLAGAETTMTGDELGGLLASAIASPDLAVTLIGTQITTVTGMAAQDYYFATSVSMGRWVNEGDTKVCPVCLNNTAASPVKIGDPYPSGDTHEPAHPRCRCAVIPN